MYSETMVFMETDSESILMDSEGPQILESTLELLWRVQYDGHVLETLLGVLHCILNQSETMLFMKIDSEGILTDSERPQISGSTL